MLRHTRFRLDSLYVLQSTVCEWPLTAVERERERERERRLTSGAVGADTLPPVTDTRESPRDL